MTTVLTREDDGSMILQDTTPLGRYPRVLTERLVAGAQKHPNRILLAERLGDDWRKVTWAEALEAVRSIGQALLSFDLSVEKPLALLSPGSVDHGLLILAATHVGVPYCPISPAYSVQDTSGEKLAFALDLLTPGLVWVQDLEALPIAAKALADREISVLSSEAGDIATLRKTAPTAEVERAFEAIEADDIRSFIFTSGTTGRPKAVITTHRMTCANQQMFVQSFPVYAETPPEILSWLPWHHTSGANSVFGSVVYNGGTMWIDDGRPVAGAGMERTLRNLADISPTAYFSMSSGFRLLAAALRKDRELRDKFFSRLSFFFYSGSSLPAPIAAEMDEVSQIANSHPTPFFACYGATETAPFALALNRTVTTPGMVGQPMPGATIKLVPVDGLLEVRAKGDLVTPGYWRNTEATKAAFDAAGFYCYGDALRPLDPEAPQRGLIFDGRLGENFKLTTGTWVNVAGLREKILNAAGDLLADVVVAGEGRDEVGALLFPEPARNKGKSVQAIIRELSPILEDLAQSGTGSSTFVARALVLTEPPNPAAGELTDKGSVSPRMILRNRAAKVRQMYAPTPVPEKIGLWRRRG